MILDKGLGTRDIVSIWTIFLAVQNCIIYFVKIKALTTQKLRKGEIKALYSGRLMVLKWKDKKDVHMLSTIHDASTKEVGSTNAPKVKPKVCCDYNDTMSGVDLSDAFLSAYPSSRK